MSGWENSKLNPESRIHLRKLFDKADELQQPAPGFQIQNLKEVLYELTVAAKATIDYVEKNHMTIPQKNEKLILRWMECMRDFFSLSISEYKKIILELEFQKKSFWRQKFEWAKRILFGDNG